MRRDVSRGTVMILFIGLLVILTAVSSQAASLYKSYLPLIPLASTVTPTTTPTTSPTTSPSSDPIITDVVALVNSERAKVGCGSLKLDTQLVASAQRHSSDMAATGNFSHTGSDGSSLSDRIIAAGYSYWTAGENIAYGYKTAEAVMAAWMDSSGHRENILDCDFEDIGVAYAYASSGRIYWTQDFGTRR